MVKEREKEQLLQQMNIILTEIQRFMTIYESLKAQLFDEEFTNPSDSNKSETSKFTYEIENQGYLNGKRRSMPLYDYQSLALTVASILKESGRPLSTKELYQSITEKGYVLTKTNFTVLF